MAVFASGAPQKPLVLVVDYTAKGPYYTLQAPYSKAAVDQWKSVVRSGGVTGDDVAWDVIFNLGYSGQVLSQSRVFPQSVEGISDVLTARLVEYAQKAGVPLVTQLDEKQWRKSFSNIVLNRARNDIVEAVGALRDAYVIEKNQNEVAYLERVLTNLQNTSLAPMALGMAALLIYGKYTKARFKWPNADRFWERALPALARSVDALRKFNPTRRGLYGLGRR